MADQILSDASIAQFNAAKLPISLAAFEEIVSDEDTSESFYNGHYRHPEWPGGASGVTIALGYDLGYASKDKITKDYKGKIPDTMLNACLSVSGITGSAAHDAMLRVRSSIDIPWPVALDVFIHNDIPQWLATNDKILPNMNMLTPDCRGVLLSLSYNRGASYDRSGDRYREMRAIKADMNLKHFSDVSNQLRSMSRLWPVGNGVHSRRLREASLWDKGMEGMAVS